MRIHLYGLFVLSLLLFPIEANSEAAKIETQTSNNGAETTKTTAVTTPPNSSNNYLDDTFQWPTAVPARAQLTEENKICIPPGTKVTGAKASLDSTTTTTTNNANGKSESSSTQWEEVYLDTHPQFLGIFGAPSNVEGSPPDRVVRSVNLCGITDTQDLHEGQTIYVSSDDIARASRTGWDYGVLIAPFKLQLSKGKEFSGSASIGPYLGYRFPLGDSGLTINLVGFAGASNISVNTVDPAGKSTSQSLAGLSYGGGLVTIVKDSFQVGILLGADHVNTSAGYKYNNKPWLSFEIGYSFMQ